MEYVVVEGEVVLVDNDGNFLSTASGIDGNKLKVTSDLDTTVSGNAVKVREQNLDAEGYIKNSSHNMGQYNSQWQPFSLDDQGRLRVVSETAMESHTIASHSDTVASGFQLNELVGGGTTTLHTHTGLGVTDHAALTNIGINTHNEIDAHITTISGNPHGVNEGDILPNQIGNDGKYLQTDGTNSSWVTVSGSADYAGTIVVAKTGGDYNTIQAAIDASVSGETILIYDGTYEENVVTKPGSMTSLVGVGTMGGVVIKANTDTVLTVPFTPMSMAFLKNFKLKSTVSGINTSKLFSGNGLMTTFKDISFDYNINNGHTEEIIDLDAGSYVFSNCKFDYDSLGVSGGESSFISADGSVEFQIMQGFGTMTCESIDSSDRLRFIDDLSSGSNIVRDFDFQAEATSASYAGGVGFYMSENPNDVEILGNKIVLTTVSGVGASRGNAIHLNGTGGGRAHLTTNRVSVTGFVNNNFGMINDTETMFSHFDDIVANNGVIGDGAYYYANSPSQGDIQMSGDIIRKVVDITADYDENEDWIFGILNADSTMTGDVTVTVRPSVFSEVPNGAYRTFLNSSDAYTLILDPNGLNFGGSVNVRAIYPGGHITAEKVGNRVVITSLYNTSFNIDLDAILNKTFHVDFSDASTIGEIGGDITYVVDKISTTSGTPSSTGYAKYGITTQNNLNTALFNTSNSPISFGDRDLHNNTAGRGMTIIAVVKPVGAYDAIISKYYDATPQKEWYLYTNTAYIFTNLDGSGYRASLSYTPSIGDWMIVHLEWAPGQSCKLYKNGYHINTSINSVSAIPEGTAELLLGALDVSRSDFMGEMAEIFAVSDILTAEEREAITSKFGAKWGIDVSSPSIVQSALFQRIPLTSTIVPEVSNDNLDIGTGTFSAGDIITTGTVNGINIASDVTANTAKTTNAVHTGEVTGSGVLTITDNVIDEANLKLDESPIDDYVLTADLAKSGGMKWAINPTGVTDFLGLIDTPSSYSEGKHLRVTASGIEFNSHKIEYSLYTSPNYTGEFSDGTMEYPFKTLQELAVFSYTTYTGVNDAVTIHCLPGIYYFDDTTFTQNPTTKAIVGTDPTTVVFKPTVDILGKPMLGTTVPVSVRNITIDGTDIPAMRTTEGTVGYQVTEGGYNQIDITDCKIKGFYHNIFVTDSSNIYAKGVDLSDSTINVTVSSGSIFDADICYMFDSEVAHVHAIDDSKVYIEGSELYSWNVTQASGVAVLAEGEAHVELFGGTNVWGCARNIKVIDDAKVFVDNCVIEASMTNPGIEQKGTSTLHILNSRAPLSYQDIDIDNSTNVYINAFDSTVGRTTMGKAQDTQIDLFSVNIGDSTDPILRYDNNYYGYKGMIFKNPADGTKTMLAVESTNQESELLAITKGSNAWAHGVYFNLYSDQSGSMRGWEVGKGVGSTPPFTFKYYGSNLALQLNHNGSIQLNSGALVNKILDEDDLNSNDAYALVTQQSVRAYIDNTTYSTATLDGGQLNDLYYTEDEVNTISGSLQEAIDDKADLVHEHTASGIEYIRDGWDVDNLCDTVDSSLDYVEDVLGSGRVTPEVVLTGEFTDIVSIEAGYGYINYTGLHKKISWEVSTVNMIGYAEGIYYLYVDTNAAIQISTTNPGRTHVILLGFINYTGSSIALVQQCGCVIEGTFNRVVDYMFALGPFLTTDAGLIQTMPSNPLKIISPPCVIQYGLLGLSQNEISSDDAGTSMFSYYRSADAGWENNHYFAASGGYGGAVCTERWNDTAAFSNLTLSGVYTFTENSSLVTTTYMDTNLEAGDFIFLDADGHQYMSPVDTISGTNITLATPYTGPGGAGLSIVNKALPTLPDNKWVKHIVLRTFNNSMRLILSQAYYDSEDEAMSAGMPMIPTAIEQSNVKMATIVLQKGTTDLHGCIYDIRPLPFHNREGGSQSGSAASDHGALFGLSSDDHTQYILANGARSFTSAINYTSHPSFSSETELVDKKYVDDGLSVLTINHGELNDLSNDDHLQYHNDTRGDIRYYTKTQVDANLAGHHSVSSTDHDDRYYTETEVDSIVTTLSGVLQSTINNIAIGDLPAIHLSRTTDFIFTTDFEDVLFDTSDVETDESVLEHASANTERVNIKETGLYFISYKFQVERTSTNYSYARVQKNNSTTVAGSESEVNTYIGEVHELTGVFVAELQENDYITLQGRSVVLSTTGHDDTTFTVIRLSGLRGEKGEKGTPGATGTGSSINILADNTVVASNTTNLNFEGDITVTSGIANTTVVIGQRETVQCYTTLTTSVNTTTPVEISWNNQDLIDTGTFIHSTTVNPSRLYVDMTGWYEVSYNVYYNGATYRSNVRGRLRKNGIIYLGRGTAVNYTRDTTNGNGSIAAGPFLIQLTAGDYVELMCDKQGGSTTCNLVADDNYIRMSLFRTT